MIEKKLFHEVPSRAEFHSAAMTTFSFDFHYFESQVLKVLKSKGVINVNIFVDASMLDQSIGTATGHLKSLSTSYSINGVHAKGAFHPKLALLAGENDLLLIQGSGNITNGGHGKNHEVFSVFYANKEEQSQLPLIREAWEYLLQITKATQGLSATKLEWMRTNCSLLHDQHSNSDQQHAFHQLEGNFNAALIYNGTTSIWQQLQTLVPNTVEEIKVFSPFYDEKGTLLSTIAAHFLTAKIDVFLPEQKGIHPYKMEANNRFRFLAWESTQRAQKRLGKHYKKPHGKIFWFKHGAIEYCLLGSANATMAAFGSNTVRGANEEFSVLIKVEGRNLLKELGLNGDYEAVVPKENTVYEEIENAFEEEKVASNARIRVLGADQIGSEITLFVKNHNNLMSVSIQFFNQWGDVLEEKPLALTAEKLKVKITNQQDIKAIAYVALFDDNDQLISNKQVVNNLHDLWNTNPSAENRRLMKLSSLIETGSSNDVFAIIDFYNTIYASKVGQTVLKTSGGHVGSNFSTTPELTTLTYEEAIESYEEEQKRNQLSNALASVKLWDSMEKHFLDIAKLEEEENMDDEEQASATSGRERPAEKTFKTSFELNSIKVLDKRRKEIQKFFNNYMLHTKQTQDLNSPLDLVDFATFLIVMKQITMFARCEVTFKLISEDERSKTVHLLPLKGEVPQLSNYSGVMIMMIGHFVNLLATKEIAQHTDEYYKTKLTHYINLSRRSILVGLALISKLYLLDKKVVKWTDVLAMNVLHYLGGHKQDLGTAYEDEMKSSLLKRVTPQEIMNTIVLWIEKYEGKAWEAEYYSGNKTGLCVVVKYIPSIADAKYLKLSRPGFLFDEDLKDFQLKELYNLRTNSLEKSLQKFKKHQKATRGL